MLEALIFDDSDQAANRVTILLRSRPLVKKVHARKVCLLILLVSKAEIKVLLSLVHFCTTLKKIISTIHNISERNC